MVIIKDSLHNTELIPINPKTDKLKTLDEIEKSFPSGQFFFSFSFFLFLKKNQNFKFFRSRRNSRWNETHFEE